MRTSIYSSIYLFILLKSWLLRHFPVNFRFSYFIFTEVWKRQGPSLNEQFACPGELFETEIDKKRKSHFGCFVAGRFCPEHLETCKQSQMGRELPSVPPRSSREGPGFLFPGFVGAIKCRVIDETLFAEKLSASPPWPISFRITACGTTVTYFLI